VELAWGENLVSIAGNIELAFQFLGKSAKENELAKEWAREDSGLCNGYKMIQGLLK